MIHELVNLLDDPPQNGMLQVFIAILGPEIAIVGLLIEYKNIGKFNIGVLIMIGLIVIGALFVIFSRHITGCLNNCELRIEIHSRMQAIDDEYPYQLSIADSNNNVYFVFCKTKDDQNKVIKTMNTGNSPTIKYSNGTATYIDISQHIKNGAQVEKQIKEKYLLDIVKNSFSAF